MIPVDAIVGGHLIYMLPLMHWHPLAQWRTNQQRITFLLACAPRQLMLAGRRRIPDTMTSHRGSTIGISTVGCNGYYDPLLSLIIFLLMYRGLCQFALKNLGVLIQDAWYVLGLSQDGSNINRVPKWYVDGIMFADWIDAHVTGG